MMISVNGVELSDEAVYAEMQYHPADDAGAAQREAAVALIVRELLIQEAARLGIDGGSEEARMQALIECEVRTPEPDEMTCRRYYDNNRRRFRSPDICEGHHILFAAAPDDGDARAAAREKAEGAIARLQAEPDLFEDLARELSDCPSKTMGGNLGQVTRGSTVPEFETFLFNLEDGQLCPIAVESRYGFHVVRLGRKIAGGELPFEIVADKIAEYLAQAAWTRAVHQYIQILVGHARVTGIQLEGAASPLVQ
jgi:peptidyl-prolyl cis-trans isomerase C